jgi:cytochrome c oxidase assembly factor CtaG
MFLMIRKVALYIFIASIIAFSIIAILAVWQVFDGKVVSRSLGSLITITISLLLIVGAVNWRVTGNVVKTNPSTESISVGRAILYTILAVLLIPFMFGFLMELTRLGRF